jgi:hypothetical protein
MRGLAVGIFDHLNIVGGERRIDLSPDDERGEIARSQLIDLGPSIRVHDKRAI